MYQLIKLYFRLFFKNNKGLLIILILLFTSFSTLYINLHQTKINRDTTIQIYDQYIDKYSGIPNNSKEKQILKELDSYENNEDILKEYQNHQITQKEYLKKQRKNNSNILNLNCIVESDLSESRANSSSDKELSNCSFDSSGTTPELISTKHRGGNITHHQFCPLASPISTLSAS